LDPKTKYLKRLFLLTLLVLFVGQFDPLFYGISIIMLISLSLAVILFALIPFYTSNLFNYILVLYIVSHFRIHDVFGSLGVALAFAGFFVISGKYYRIRELRCTDKTIGFYFAILLLFNVLGWILKSQLSAEHLLSGVISFIVLALVFYFASRLFLNYGRINIIVNIIALLSIYGLITAIINGLNLSPIRSNLFGNYYSVNDINIPSNSTEQGHAFISMIDRPTGELGLIYFSFLLPVYVFYNKINKFVVIRKILLLIGLISSFLLCFIEFSKSHTVVLFSSLLFTLFFAGFILKISSGFGGARNYLLVGLVLLVFVLATYPLIRYDYILDRFNQQPELFKNLAENPLTAEGTSRSDSWGLAYKYISDNNFFIGYGYANGSQNRIAWLGPENVDYPKLDYHNLYYSFIPVFGWIGTFSILMIILITAIRLIRIATRTIYLVSYRVIAFAFFNLILFFLIGELSINAMSSPHYMMLIYIVFGLANALYYNRANFIDEAYNSRSNFFQISNSREVKS
jgi:hypothetical protein